MNRFSETIPAVYNGASDRSWRWSDRVRGALFVLVVVGLACGWFPE